METRHLKSFLKIAETRSISRAAESLGIAQPSLSQQLLRLEDEVGLQLFQRTARGVTLTEAGRLFQEHARHILGSTERALEDVRQLNAAARGQVVLAAPPAVCGLIGVRLVEMLEREAPQVSVRLVEAFTGTIRGWLEAGKIDLGILYEVGPLRHLAIRSLASEEMFLVGPEGAFASAGDGTLDEVAPERIAQLPLVTAGPQHGLRQVIERDAGRLGLGLQIAHEIDAMGQILALVAAGHGYSILPRPAVADDLAAGRLSIARIGSGVFRGSICLVRNPLHVVSYASVRIEDLLARVLSDLIAAQLWDAQPDPSLP